MTNAPRRNLTRPPVDDLGEEMARLLIERMRAAIDHRYENPAARESSWRSFLAMAGEWATDDGLKHPGAYNALKPIVERLCQMMVPRKITATSPYGTPMLRRVPEDKG